MQVRILIDKDSPLNSRGFLGGRFKLTKAMPRGRFSIREEKISDCLALVVEKASHRRAWDPGVFFTPEKCQALADEFSFAVMLGKFGYYPSLAE